MNWLLVSSAHHPSHGGIGTYVTAFVDAAARAGWTVHLVTRPSDLHPSGAIIHPVSTLDDEPGFASRLGRLREIERVRPYRYGLWSLAAAKALLELDFEPDVIEFVDSRAEGVVGLGSGQVRNRFAGVPMIVVAHTPMFVEEAINGADPDRFGRSIYHAWERDALAAADGVIVSSRILASKLPRSSDSTIIPLPCRFEEQVEADSEVGPGRRIVFVGTIQPRKGIDVWAESLNRVLRERPDVEAMVIGGDTPTGPGGSSMADFARSTIDPSVLGRVTWIGPRSPDETRSIMVGASVVVVPSRFESFSYVAAESIALWRPVIVTDGVGLVEYAPDLPCVPAGRADRLAEAQLRVLDDPVAAAATANRCREQLRASTDPASILRRREAFVESIRQGRMRSGTASGPDAIDVMDRFLRDVERMEAPARPRTRLAAP